MYLFTVSIFFFNDTATTEIYTLSLHDALPICCGSPISWLDLLCPAPQRRRAARPARRRSQPSRVLQQGHRRHLYRTEGGRSEEHTSELQSLAYLVCRLLLEKKKLNHSKREYQ